MYSHPLRYYAVHLLQPRNPWDIGAILRRCKTAWGFFEVDVRESNDGDLIQVVGGVAYCVGVCWMENLPALTKDVWVLAYGRGFGVREQAIRALDPGIRGRSGGDRSILTISSQD